MSCLCASHRHEAQQVRPRGVGVASMRSLRVAAMVTRAASTWTATCHLCLAAESVSVCGESTLRNSGVHAVLLNDALPWMHEMHSGCLSPAAIPRLTTAVGTSTSGSSATCPSTGRTSAPNYSGAATPCGIRVAGRSTTGARPPASGRGGAGRRSGFRKSVAFDLISGLLLLRC